MDQHLIRQKKSDHMEDQNCLSLCLQPSMFNEFQVVPDAPSTSASVNDGARAVPPGYHGTGKCPLPSDAVL